jgi:hypothetical protein
MIDSELLLHIRYDRRHQREAAERVHPLFPTPAE